MTDVPTTVPDELVVGDTWAWTRELPDYPAGTWVLTHYFENADATFSVQATASGTRHAFAVSAATTATYRPGEYRVRGRVVSGADKYTLPGELFRVRLTVDPAAAGTVDVRGKWRQLADALMATIEGKATSDQQQMSIGGRMISRMSWTQLREAYEWADREAKSEERREAMAAGRAPRTRLQVRF